MNSENGGKIALDLFCHVGLVHGVNVDICDAVGVEINDLVCGVGDACLLHCRGIRAKHVHKTFKTLGHKGARQLDGACHLIPIGDRHDSRDDRNGDAGFTDLVEKIVE